jgi:hypothetical protein
VPAAVHHLGAADEDARIDAERPTNQAEHDDCSDSEAAAPDRDTDASASTETAVVTSTVFNVVAAAEIVPTHREFLQAFA